MKKLAPIVVLILATLACNFPSQTRLRLTPSPTDQLIDLLPTQPAATPTPFQPPTSTPVPPTVTPTSTQLPTPIPTYQPLFQPAACRFPIPEGTNPECGDLILPEDRSHPEGRQIALHVAIFHSTSSQPAVDPVLYLSGGPGSSALELAGYMFATGFGRIQGRRDLIFFDQRGVGYSQPQLACPEVQAVKEELLAGEGSPQSSAQAVVEAYQRCHDRLTGEGVNLAQYNSAASAADVDDLRKALGYRQVNLYGDSYGTRLALTVMRDHPDGLRSVILDSVYPPQQDLYLPLAANAERAFNVLFDNCAADPTCNHAYPDLKTSFYELVDRLDAQPVDITLPEGGAGAGRQVRLTGGLLVDVLFTGMYKRGVIAWMPKMIAQINAGVYDLLIGRLRLYFEEDTGGGMTISVQCHEELPFGSPEKLIESSTAARREIANFYTARLLPLYSVCPLWGAGAPDAIENQPVRSTVPALVLAGEYDPITPPVWSQETASYLPNSYFFEYPGIGHWVLRSSLCPLEMALAFLDEPSHPPDSTCIASMGGLSFH